MKQGQNDTKTPEIDESYLDRKEHKVKISAFVDGDIIDALRDRAEKSGGKYQTLMNKILRDALFGDDKKTVSISEDVIAEIAALVTKKMIMNYIEEESQEVIKVDRHLVADKKKKSKSSGTKKHAR